MSVEPQNEQFAPRLNRMAGDAADGPHRQAVIAAEYDRRASGPRDCIGFASQRPRPGRHIGEPMRLAFRRGRVDKRMGRGEVAAVLDVMAEVPQRLHDPGGAQHGRPHRRARHACPRLDRRAEDGDRPRERQRRPDLESIPGNPLPAHGFTLP